MAEMNLDLEGEMEVQEIVENLISGPESDDISGVAANGLGKKKGVRRSRVYDYFTQDEKTLKWKCKIKPCSTQLANPKSGGTGSMINHLKNIHRKKYLEYLTLTASQNQNPITNFVTAEKALPKEPEPVYDPKVFKNKLVKFIITTNQPFTLVEDKAFQELLEYVSSEESNVTIPNRQPLRNIISQKYKDMLAELKKTLNENVSKISFSVDGWTSRNGYAFQGVVAHLIDDEWTLKTMLLDLSIIEGNHSGANLAENFGEVLTRFDIWTKLLAVTSDNASNMNTFAERLEIAAKEHGSMFEAKNFRIRCMAHIINLACQEVVKALGSSSFVEEPEFQYIDEDNAEGDSDEEFVSSMESVNVVDKLRKACVGIRSSPQRRDQLAKQCQAAGMEPLNVILDVRTRWNSTFQMLERAVILKKPLQLTLQSFKNLQHLTLSVTEWSLVEKILSLLKPFQEATKLLSKEGIPKLSKTLTIYNALFEHLEKYTENVTTSYRSRKDIPTPSLIDITIKNAADAGWSKLSDYYPTTDGVIFAVATVLDPRFKCQWYNLAGWKKEWITQCRSMVRRVWISHYKEKNEHYTSTQQHTNQPHLNSGLETAILLKFQSQNDGNPTDELSRYLSEQPETIDAISQLSKENGGKDGVLCWWKNNQHSYPQLSKMARDFLAASSTGVPCERVFSSAPDLLTNRRQRLEAETIRECLCLKLWYKADVVESILEAVGDKALGEAI